MELITINCTANMELLKAMPRQINTEVWFFCLLVLVGAHRNDSDQIKELCRFVPKKALKIANKSVDVSLPRGLMDDVLVIVVSKSTR